MENQEERFVRPLPDMGTGNSLLLTSSVEIFNALISSKENGLAIGICTHEFTPQVLTTCVEDIHFEEGATVIILKHYDSTGYILPSTRVALQDIQSVCLFKTPFLNPFLAQLDKAKTWFF